MSDQPLPTRLRAILSRTPKKNATDEQVDQFFDDLNAIIHDIEDRDRHGARAASAKEGAMWMMSNAEAAVFVAVVVVAVAIAMLT